MLKTPVAYSVKIYVNNCGIDGFSVFVYATQTKDRQTECVNDNPNTRESFIYEKHISETVLYRKNVIFIVPLCI